MVVRRRGGVSGPELSPPEYLTLPVPAHPFDKYRHHRWCPWLQSCHLIFKPVDFAACLLCSPPLLERAGAVGREPSPRVRNSKALYPNMLCSVSVLNLNCDGLGDTEGLPLSHCLCFWCKADSSFLRFLNPLKDFRFSPSQSQSWKEVYSPVSYYLSFLPPGWEKCFFFVCYNVIF